MRKPPIGVSKSETLNFSVFREGIGSAVILTFDCKDYETDSGIPFIKIARPVRTDR
jgi:hypothetical protein